MVLYYTSTAVDPPTQIFMGKDKFENEDLVKHGVEEDFHVDKLSSAHVYIRLAPGETWERIPEPLLADAAQLTKANSIEGNKKDNLIIIYTPWSNLKKSGDMAVGQVSFHNPRIVKRIFVKERINVIVNRLNKTKVEEHPDLYQKKMDHMTKKSTQNAATSKRMAELQVKREKYYKEQKELKSYTAIFDQQPMKTNEHHDGKTVDELEEDFM